MYSIEKIDRMRERFFLIGEIVLIAYLSVSVVVSRVADLDNISALLMLLSLMSMALMIFGVPCIAGYVILTAIRELEDDESHGEKNLRVRFWASERDNILITAGMLAFYAIAMSM